MQRKITIKQKSIEIRTARLSEKLNALAEQKTAYGASTVLKYDDVLKQTRASLSIIATLLCQSHIDSFSKELMVSLIGFYNQAALVFQTKWIEMETLHRLEGHNSVSNYISCMCKYEKDEWQVVIDQCKNCCFMTGDISSYSFFSQTESLFNAALWGYFDCLPIDALVVASSAQPSSNIRRCDNFVYPAVSVTMASIFNAEEKLPAMQQQKEMDAIDRFRKAAKYLYTNDECEGDLSPPPLLPLPDGVSAEQAMESYVSSELSNYRLMKS